MRQHVWSPADKRVLPTGAEVTSSTFAGQASALAQAVWTSVDTGPAGGWPEEAQDQAQSSGLARAIGSQQSEYLAGSHPEIEVVQGPVPAVILGQMFRAEEHEEVL